MADAGVHRFPLPLDPTAQEFRPTTYVYYYSYTPPFIIPPSSTAPTRAILLSSVPTNVSESTVRRELEVFGDVRAVQMERLRHGIVTVHFYDLRHATHALNTIQQQHMQQQLLIRHSLAFSYPPPLPLPAPGLICGRVIWAQFTFPFVATLPDRYNQGTVVVTSDSTDAVRDAFEAIGDVKEIRESPLRKKHKFVEFYDTRDATKAVAAVNGQEVNGKQVVVEVVRLNDNKQSKIINPQSILSCKKESMVVVNSPLGGGFKKNIVKNLYKQCGGRNKPWKGPHRKKCDPKFLIKVDDLVSSIQDLRTTVMIKNIPNKYSQKLLLKMLDKHCLQCNEEDNQEPLCSYDFVYLPIDFVNKCNVGYGFVNMTSPEATWRLYKAFNHQSWEIFNSKKICEVSYARLQGLEALKEHFKKSKFPCEAEEYLPVVFTPPRDGRTVTEPIPVVGRAITMTSEVGRG